MKQYLVRKMHRGTQYEAKCCAKSRKIASRILSVNEYNLKAYGYSMPIEEIFNNVLTRFDSGQLFREYPSLIRVWMPQEKIIELINTIKDKEYCRFEQSLTKTK